MPELTEIKGVSESRAEDLRDADFVTVDDVATASVDALSSVSGIGEATADGLIESAQNVLRDSTLDTDEDDEPEPEGVPDLEEEENDDEDEVTEEDIEDLLAEEPDGEPDDEPTVEDDEGEPEEVDVTPEGYDVIISIDNSVQYDYFYHAIIEMREGDIYTSHQQTQVAVDILEQLRELPGEGRVTLNLSQNNLNALHAVIVQARTAYKSYGTDAFNAIQHIEDQVKEARQPFL